jgi:hypothetical protein
LHSAFDHATSFRLPKASSPTLRFRHRPLRLRALAFDASGVVSLAFDLADFKFVRIQFLFLPHRFAILRSRLPWLRFPLSPSTLWVAVHSYLCFQLLQFRFVACRSVSTSLTFLRIRFLHRSALHVFGFTQLVPFTIYLVAPGLRPQGGGVGHRRQNKTPKTPNQKPTKKKTATITTRRRRSRLIHGRSVQS